MRNYSLIMITTHQNDVAISDLLKSVDENSKDLSILIVIVSQGIKVNFSIKNSLLNLIFIDEAKISLSKARNIALNYVSQNNLSADYIMFPDDDSSFDAVFFENFKSIQSLGSNYITPIYNTGTKDVYLGKKPNDTVVSIRDYNMVGSPNQIIQYSKFKDFIYFDEELGVGAKYGSSEDLDLFIRLNLAGAKFIYTDRIYTYHPKKTDVYKHKSLKEIVSRFRNYSSGFALLIFRYRLYSFIPTYIFRTFAAFLVFAVKLNFKLSLAYLIQFFVRIQLLWFFWLNNKKSNNNEYSGN